MTSDELLGIDHVPENLVIVGGGVIGCEFAGIFSRLGTHVTVVEMLGQLLPGEDRRVAQTLQQAFRKSGIEVLLNSAVEGCEASAAGLTLSLTGGRELTAARVLVAVGRKPVSAGLGYAEAGVVLDERGFVGVDETLRTSVPGVFAAGDLAGLPLLAHWAYHQGAVAAENAVTGSNLRYDGSVVPNCVFTSPEVASCGLTEDSAAAEGREVEVTGVRFGGNSKALIAGETDGFVRLVCEPHGGRLLGASLVGPHVTELVAELALAVQADLTLADVAATIHAHPTLSEAVGEVALNGLGRRIHSL
jgi:dihydrolipoamide dehydrogenase